MKHIVGLDQIQLSECCLTVGVFDGVHRGHQQIIDRLQDRARQRGVPTVVVTFWPHPAAVLGRAQLRCLTTDAERAALLGSLGVDFVVTQRFDSALASTSYEEFVGLLKRRLGFREFLIGYDFALGRDREGNASRLAALGKQLQYDLDVVPALGDESGVISSTEIRKLVATGDVAEAAKLLGHYFDVQGTVIHGDSRGLQLGFPTANIAPPAEKILPGNGVYAAWASVGASRFRAAVNVGIRPQFHDEAEAPLVEAHLLDFDNRIYGEAVRVEFVKRLRDETRFDSVDSLIEQMHRDVDLVRRLLAAT